MLSLYLLLAVEMAAETAPAPNLAGWAAIISAVGVAFASAVTAINLMLTRQMNRTVNKVDHAVNGQPPGTKPLVSQVQDLHAQIPIPLTAKAAWLEAAVSAIAEAQGVDLPERPNT